MQNQIVVTSGYMGSGSSAVTDLLTEIDGYKNATGSFEYIFMHCPGGLFDLEDKLLLGNNALRSDEALHVFLETMQDLYCKRGYWPSGYKYYLSADFLKYCEDLIREILCVSVEETFWYYQENSQNLKMLVENCLYCKKIMRKLGMKKPLRYNKMLFAYPTEDEFYPAAKNFLEKIFTDMGRKSGNIIVDQLLLPHNLHRIDRYFGDELKVFVVERDPRDVFLINKYYWSQQNAQVPYTYDVNDFCKMYRALRNNEKTVNDERILRLSFENLVYDYDNVLKHIYSFLNIDPRKHTQKLQLFNPQISVNNTQIFRRNEKYSEESEIIAKLLPEYIYDFSDKESVPSFDAELF